MGVALVTGANRGIGFEVARQLAERGHVVYVGARNRAHGHAAASRIGARVVALDVTDDASVTQALGRIADEEGRLDILINNAGVQEFDPVDGPLALRAFDTNAVGVVRVTEAALPLLRAAAVPTVVTVSSSAGSFGAVTDPERPEYHLTNAVYAASKAAATMLTLQYAKAHPEMRINAIEPGYTATDMTAGFEGGRPVEDSARAVVELATLGASAPTGTLRDENGVLPW
ncbi:SDR family NAD(P)-dependent oxidoreductase [Microbacterium sp. BLY]|uniref:SDR family NAD(P)-dependent oxidoreductase n=1 Tax=Microbacterium sp. BLY TaxID=2823280 RepID=UPI001B330C69|nr:SDR family NAD(P)-dependent oxidoreductase [Microbacterium sp. BLY]MBP3976402.1 SDR family NAD(P)-dependent oxidoreductase [Microbacterium sp. BLY]